MSTFGGVTGGGTLPGTTGVSATDGSRYISSPFAALDNANLSYWFNYVTTDGTPSFPDYAWAELRDASGLVTVATLLTARTRPPPQDTVPGFGMPPMSPGVVLAPPNTAIIPGGPEWSPLGGASDGSGACYQGAGQGCGYTGWINSTFTIEDAGLYTLVFGVSNVGDTAFESGLAFAGLFVDGDPIDPVGQVPIPAALPLFASGLAGLGWLARRRKKSQAAA